MELHLDVMVMRTKNSMDFYCEECYYAHDKPEWLWCKHVDHDDVFNEFPKGFRCDYCGCDEHGHYIEMDN